METRVVEQVKIHVLEMNPVTSNMEHRVPVAWSYYREPLERLLEEDKLEETEQVDGYYLAYKEGPLRRMNFPLENEDPIADFWIEQGSQNAGALANIPHIQ